jgi:hypothetical protein
LQKLIANGVLPVGTEVFHEGRMHKKRKVTARIEAGGIEVAGRVYPNSSGAARAVSGPAAENG